MTPAQKRKQELEAYKAQFLKLVGERRSVGAVHEKMKQITTKQLRCEIRQDKKRTA
jgi:hypothetical protein